MKLTLTDEQYFALPKVVEHYWPDTDGQVELEQAEPHGALIVRLFNRGLDPREVAIRPDGRTSR